MAMAINIGILRVRLGIPYILVTTRFEASKQLFTPLQQPCSS